RTRFQRLEEQVQAMKRLWTEDAAAFDGRFVRFTESLSYPKPAQTPHPPLLLGGESDHTLRRIVRFCDGWLPRARGGFDAAQNLQRLERIAAEHGRPMDTLCVGVFVARPVAVSLQRYRGGGFSRATLPLPAAARDDVWRVLDRYPPLL